MAMQKKLSDDSIGERRGGRGPGVSDIVYANIRKMIIDGRFPRGERLPSERVLEKELETSRATISKAIVRLTSEGLVCKKQGRKGSFIVDQQRQSSTRSSSRRLIKFIGPSRRSLRGREESRVSHGTLEGIYDVFQKQDIEVGVAFVAGEDKDLYETVIGSGQPQCAGLIAWYEPMVFTKSFMDRVKAGNIPLVLVDAYPQSQDVDYVVTDNINGAHQMVDYLVELGHSRICYVNHVKHPDNRSSVLDRKAGFLRGMVDNGLKLSNVDILDIAEDFAAEAERIGQMMVGRKKAWTAIATNQDEIAIAIERVLLKLGLKIPQDISLMGYDDIDQSKLMPVPLTTVKQDFYDMGRVAAETILERLNGSAFRRPSQVYLPPTLIERGSVARPRDDEAAAREFGCDSAAKRGVRAVSAAAK